MTQEYHLAIFNYPISIVSMVKCLADRDKSCNYFGLSKGRSVYFDNMYMYEKYMCLILRDLLTLCNYCMSTTLLFMAKPLSIKFYLGFERLNVQLHDRMDAFTGLCPY